MSSHLKCALTHVVFGVLLFVMGIVDLGVNYGEYWTGFRVFVLVCGVWVGKLRYFCQWCKRKENKVTYFSLHQVSRRKSTFKTVSGL